MCSKLYVLVQMTHLSWCWHALEFNPAACIKLYSPLNTSRVTGANHSKDSFFYFRSALKQSFYFFLFPLRKWTWNVKVVHSDVLVKFYLDLQILCILAGNLTLPNINSDIREQKQCVATAHIHKSAKWKPDHLNNPKLVCFWTQDNSLLLFGESWLASM